MANADENIDGSPDLGRELFVCYSRHDSAVVEQIICGLEKRGVRCWMDKTGIAGSKIWMRSVVEGIHRCSKVIFFGSEHSYTSQWVGRELTVAFDEKRPVVFVRLDRAEPKNEFKLLTAGINYIQHEPGRLKDTIASLLRACQAAQSTSEHDVSSPSVRQSATSGRLLSAKQWCGLVGGAVIVLTGAISVGRIVPNQVNKRLAYSWQMDSPQASYEKALSWEQSVLLRDKSVAAYWRVLSFQSMHEQSRDNDPKSFRIAEIDQVYRDAVRRFPTGRNADGILYRYAQFLRNVDRVNDAREFFLRVQNEFPLSYWRAGTAFYLAKLAFEFEDEKEAVRQIQLLEAMPLDSRLYDFDAKKHISVREALVTLRQTEPVEQSNDDG